MTRAYSFIITTFKLFTDFEEMSVSPQSTGLKYRASYRPGAYKYNIEERSHNNFHRGI